MISRTDELVADYLARVDLAGAGLPPARRAELIADLREHIAAARAELSPETETEAAVRTVLDRLGDPAAIVAEAAVGEPTAPQAVPVLPVPPPVAPQAPRSNRALVVVLWVLAAVVVVPVLFCVIGLVAFRTAGSNEPAPAVSQQEVTHR